MDWFRSASITTVALLTLALFATFASADTVDDYMIYEHWGGTWADAEKTADNGDDNLMCWAASSSNILEWTGWGKVGGMTNTDEMFAHFQDNFTDAGGNPYYGWDWWFDGTNDPQGVDSWAQDNAVGGGGFYPTLDILDYRRASSDDSQAMENIDTWLTDGYGTTLSLAGNMAHSITCWGFKTTTDTSGSTSYTGVWVTDSDDSKYGNGARPNLLRYYEVSTGSHYDADLEQDVACWYLEGYGAYISEVISLQKMPSVVPLPGAAAMGLGLLCLLGAARHVRRKRSA